MQPIPTAKQLGVNMKRTMYTQADSLELHVEKGREDDPEKCGEKLKRKTIKAQKEARQAEAED